ncbi:MAG: DUF5996 family protein [Actinomycetia bacterium]|nr:DUF5996 family protein [Actinomycetes bacterium]
METMPYNDWKETADVFHMIIQMMGKIKLEKMSPQPEWNHSLVSITAKGFSTGLIPDGDESFEITIDLIDGLVVVNSTSGKTASFELREKTSVADYYAELLGALSFIGHPVSINPVPQEYYLSTPFDKQTRHFDFNKDHALTYFKMCVLARNALLEFCAPYRGKKILPALFWGGLDLTTILFSGEEKAYPHDSVIEESAFDEQLIEFGFSDGDSTNAEPYFFALAYPFMQGDLNMDAVRAKGATYSPEQALCILPFEAVMDTDNPHETIVQFCQDTFAAITGKEKWKRVKWFTKPLLIGETEQK